MISSNHANDLPDSSEPRSIEHLLAAHADALLKKPSLRQDDFDFLFDEYGLTDEETIEAEGLLAIAHQLGTTLTPVAPSDEFMLRLRNDLTGQTEPTLLLRWRKLPTFYRLAASLGGLTLTAGILLIAVRRAADVVGIIQRRNGLKTGTLTPLS